MFRRGVQGGSWLSPNHAHHHNQKAMLGYFLQAGQPNHLLFCPVFHVCAKYLLVHLKLLFMKRQKKIIINTGQPRFTYCTDEKLLLVRLNLILLLFTFAELRNQCPQLLSHIISVHFIKYHTSFRSISRIPECCKGTKCPWKSHVISTKDFRTSSQDGKVMSRLMFLSWVYISNQKHGNRIIYSLMSSSELPRKQD